ncbi:MAG: hypothetical protein CVT49_13195 [candidate division Zixibacteria bacterium HGW-Zixibacteria-1]|nr:MAG: hypothetical protein CVT49_13195 [candidate division Zixibacteria bacterium HGW-Zixibacteria-1]
MHHRLERLDDDVFRFRLTGGLLAEFSVGVDKLHQDRLPGCGRDGPRMLERLDFLGKGIGGD